MPFKDTLLGLLGLKAAPTSADGGDGRVPFPRRFHGGSFGRGAFFGNIEGYDGLLSKRGGSGKGPIDYDAEVGQATQNSAVAACLGWISTSWGNAALQVGTMNGAVAEPLDGGHPLLDLMVRPHPDYEGDWLLQSLLEDFWDAGNAYCNIVRAGLNGPPVELQYLPASTMRPAKVSDADRSLRLLTHFEYRPDGGDVILLPADNVLHFRYGMDRDDPRVGKRPLRPAFKEIYADNLASEVAAAVLRSPRPSGILSVPRSADIEPPSEDDLRITKERTEEMSTGRNAGGLIAFPFAVKFDKLSFSPKEMALDEARRKPEERIAALFGIPPVVIGLGAGLDRSTYNNMAEARKAAWSDCMIPLQDYFAAVLTHRLLPMYAGAAQRGSGKLVAYYDRSEVGVLQPDRTEDRKLALDEFKAGLITQDEARGDAGRGPMEEADADAPDQRTAEEMAVLTNAVGALIRAGFAPEDALTAVGLPPMRHTGLLPVTLQSEEEASAAAAVPPGGTAKMWADAERKGAGAGTLTLDEAAARFRSALLRREAVAVGEMTGALDATEKTLRNRLRNLTDYMADLELDGIAPAEMDRLMQQRFGELIPQVEAALADLADTGATVATAAQKAEIAASLTGAETMARAAVGPAPEGVAISWNRLQVEAMAELVGNASDGSPLRELLDAAGGDYAKQVRQVFFAGVAQGRGARDIAGDIAPLFSGTRARALATVRTEALRAGREATRRSYEANSDTVTGWTWVSATDDRTCAACWAMHGTEHGTSEKLDGHVQCRCAMAPRTKSWAEITGDDSLPDTRTVIETGETLFARLGRGEQEAILGPGLFGLYSEGGAPLSAFVTRNNDPRWGTSRDAATVAEATARLGG